MAEENETHEHEPLFSDGEAIVTAVVFSALDIIDIFEFGVPGTDIVSWVLQGFQFLKGTNGKFQALSGILEAIPGIDYLPIRTAAFLMIIWGDRHPDSKFAKLIKVAGMAKVASSVKESITKTVAAKAAAQAAQSAAAEAAQAAAAAAAEGATAAEKAAAVAAAEKSREAAEGALATGTAATTARRGAAKIVAREYARQRIEEGLTDEGEGEGDEGETKPLTLEEQREENAIKGLDIEDLALDVFSPEEMMSDIGAPTLGTKASKFDPDRAMEPKAPKKWPTQSNMNRKGIIDSERVDLKSEEKPKSREFLEDAA